MPSGRVSFHSCVNEFKLICTFFIFSLFFCIFVEKKKPSSTSFTARFMFLWNTAFFIISKILLQLPTEASGFACFWQENGRKRYSHAIFKKTHIIKCWWSNIINCSNNFIRGNRMHFMAWFVFISDYKRLVYNEIWEIRGNILKIFYFYGFKHKVYSYYKFKKIYFNFFCDSEDFCNMCIVLFFQNLHHFNIDKCKIF